MVTILQIFLLRSLQFGRESNFDCLDKHSHVSKVSFLRVNGR